MPVLTDPTSVQLETKGEERDNEAETFSEETKSELLSKLMKNINLQNQKARQTLRRINIRKIMPGYIIDKLLRTKIRRKSSVYSDENVCIQTYRNFTYRNKAQMITNLIPEAIEDRRW